LAASVLYSITFASRSKKKYDVTEAQIANKFVFLDFNVAALCNLGFYDMRLIHRAGLATTDIYYMYMQQHEWWEMLHTKRAAL